jgi:hypothetical protein
MHGWYDVPIRRIRHAERLSGSRPAMPWVMRPAGIEQPCSERFFSAGARTGARTVRTHAVQNAGGHVRASVFSLR